MIIGITGHQDLEKYDQQWIERSLEEYFVQSKVQVGVTCLAKGTDQLFAYLLNRKKITFDVIKPCHDYAETFGSEYDKNNYENLLALARNVKTLGFKEPSETAFYEGGKEVVNRSNGVIAVWDGEKAKGLGGTGDIVNFALATGKDVLHINPITQIKKFLRG